MGKASIDTFNTAGMFVFSERAIPEESSVCQLCEGGFIAKWEDGRVVSVMDCECRREKILNEWKQSQIAEVRMVFKKFDLDNTVQNPKIKLLQWGRKWPWMSGRTRQGKTHYQGYLLYNLIQHSHKTFKWVRITMKEYLNILELKRSDDDDEKTWARTREKAIMNADCIFWDDLDKVGNITASRQEEIYAFVNMCYEKGKKLCVSSNLSIAQFCHELKGREADLKSRDGQAPIEERFMDLCEEIRVVRQ